MGVNPDSGVKLVLAVKLTSWGTVHSLDRFTPGAGFTPGQVYSQGRFNPGASSLPRQVHSRSVPGPRASGHRNCCNP